MLAVSDRIEVWVLAVSDTAYEKIYHFSPILHCHGEM